ncbi:MAG: hypothetical protein AAGB05_01575 [Pseudomonadota bacterium]
MKIAQPVKQRAVTAGLVMVIAFACGFVLQESEVLGQSPNLPGKVSLEAFVEDSAKASFTSGNAVGISGATVISP